MKYLKDLLMKLEIQLEFKQINTIVKIFIQETN
jgi:hypothetical protein